MCSLLKANRFAPTKSRARSAARNCWSATTGTPSPADEEFTSAEHIGQLRAQVLFLLGSSLLYASAVAFAQLVNTHRNNTTNKEWPVGVYPRRRRWSPPHACLVRAVGQSSPCEA